MKTIINLDPSDLFCISCQCQYDRSDLIERPPQGPQQDCADQRCPCHALYWLTVPELTKRRLWGDR